MAEIYHAEVLKKKITVLITYCGVIYIFKCSSCLSYKLRYFAKDIDKILTYICHWLKHLFY